MARRNTMSNPNTTDLNTGLANAVRSLVLSYEQQMFDVRSSHSGDIEPLVHVGMIAYIEGVRNTLELANMNVSPTSDIGTFFDHMLDLHQANTFSPSVNNVRKDNKQ